MKKFHFLLIFILVVTPHLFSQEIPEVHSNNNFTLGFAFGTPSMFNLVTGYEMKYLGFELSGMFFGKDHIYGAEFSVMGLFYNKYNLRQKVFIATGISHAGTLGNKESRSWNYISAGYNFLYKKLYIKIGLSIGKGDLSNPQLTGQIGYLHSFSGM